ncbi:MAG: hypothetical protein V3T86_06510 [Planctomycetota bacterium]
MRNWVVAVGLAVLAASATAADINEEAFDKGVRSIQSSFKSRSWKTARKKLSRLLEKHREQDYVRARLPLLRELTRECAFRLEYGEPNPNSFIKGLVKTYSHTTGRAIIHFDSLDMRDWVKSSGFWIFPAMFEGPHTITIEGFRYPARSAATMIVCMDGDDAVLVSMGLMVEPRVHSGLNAEIVELVKGKRGLKAKLAASPAAGGLATKSRSSSA